MLLLYDSRSLECTDKLRHQMLIAKVTTAKSFVTPERLPPTDSSTKYHSYRTYLQINIWKDIKEKMKPEDWGWYIKNNSYYPILGDLPPAPDYLLNMIRCTCTKNCTTLRCGCKRNGLSYSTACGTCQNNGCENSSYEYGESDENDLFKFFFFKTFLKVNDLLCNIVKYILFKIW